tara:strand:- start:874 stop:1923 length:1050 start_codon:yes stop_codon:yes gene_type:complete
MKKISFVSHEDNANVFTNWSSFINESSVDYESRSLCISKHPYNYSLSHDFDINTDTDTKIQEAKKWLSESDFIIFSEENQNCYFKYSTAINFKAILGIDPIFETKGKKLAFYSGTAYRRKSQMFNQMDSKCFDRILSPLDLYRLTNKDIKTACIFMCEKTKMPTEKVTQNIIDKFNSPEWIVSHTPTNRQVKGSDFLLKIMEKTQRLCKNNIKYVETAKLSPQESLQLKDDSCFYIDTLSMGFGILSTGAHGISSLEALSYGDIVFSSTYNMEEEAIKKASYPYYTENAPYPIRNLGQTIDTASNELNHILNLDKGALIQMALDSYSWYENTSTPAKFVEKLIYEFEEC